MAEPVVLLSTCADRDTAIRVAQTLVGDKLAACVNVIDKVTSIYRWQGKVEESTEALLIIKSTKENVKDIDSVVKELSGYDLPELVALQISGGSNDYINWLLSEVGGSR